ncbi:MAG: 1-phosphofructokinase [Erysipelotrichaceae bacterium]|nr:1-phosphofructokinase [Erysipelotrichaceae bacterium]
MIYTITFNPSLDYIMHVDNFEYGETNRSSNEEMFPGGKGFNVSTILQRLGYDNTALGFKAGFSGDEIVRMLEERGFILDLVSLDNGFSRINVKMKGTKETEVNGNGPDIPEDKLALLMNKIDQISDGDTLIMAGSIPSTLPNDIYEQIMIRLQNKDVRIIVDATNELLLKVLPYHPFLIKPNHRELEEIFNASINNQKDLIDYASKLQDMGAINVLVSLGGDGAMLIDEYKHVYHCRAAKGKLINSVGSGDSMVAGFLAGYLKNNDYKDAIRLGSACGGATAFSFDLAEKSLIDEVYENIEVDTIQ